MESFTVINAFAVKRIHGKDMIILHPVFIAVIVVLSVVWNIVGRIDVEFVIENMGGRIRGKDMTYQRLPLFTHSVHILSALSIVVPIISKTIPYDNEILKDSDADTLIPVVRFSYPPQRAMEIHDGRLVFRQPENLNKRSQDLESHYHDAGQFYVLKTESFLKNKKAASVTSLAAFGLCLVLSSP